MSIASVVEKAKAIWALVLSKLALVKPTTRDFIAAGVGLAVIQLLKHVSIPVLSAVAKLF